MIDKLINDSKITIGSINLKIVQIQKEAKVDMLRMEEKLIEKTKIIAQLQA